MSFARTWLVGMNNPYGPEDKYALYPSPVRSAGYNLCYTVLGLYRAAYLRYFHRRNTMVGEKWNMKEARLGASELVKQIPLDHTIVLLGKQNWSAWESVIGVGSRVVPWEPFTVYKGISDRKVIMLPHPSGLCQIWNDPSSYSRARSVLKEASPELAGVIPQ